MNNPQLTTNENELIKKNPYDFESDDETKKDLHIDEQVLSDTEQLYRVPPLRIVLARAVLQNNER